MSNMFVCSPSIASIDKNLASLKEGIVLILKKAILYSECIDSYLEL